MLLALDIGNSSIDIGVFDASGELIAKSKISSERTKTSDEYAVLLSGILQLKGIDVHSVDGCILSSVVPLLSGPLKTAVHSLCGVFPLEVGPGIKTGLDIRIDMQTQLGADIVANAVAALLIRKAPLCIVDVGTATTFTVIDENGALQGVIIAPGLRLSMNALSAGASELPDATLALPKRLVGKNTKESMNSGVLYGHCFMIDGFLQKLKVPSQTVLLTGGLAPCVAPLLQTKTVSCPELTLTGLRTLYMKNKKEI